MSEYKWLEFRDDTHHYRKSRKTKVFTVLHKDSKIFIGDIMWYCGWRQYVFYPETNMIHDHWLSASCLKDITSFIDKLMEERG